MIFSHFFFFFLESNPQISLEREKQQKDWFFEEVARERGGEDEGEKDRERIAREGLVEYLGEVVRENEEGGLSACAFPKDGEDEEEKEEKEEEKERDISFQSSLSPSLSLPSSLSSPNSTPGATHTLSIDPQLSLSLSLLCDSLSVSLYSLSFACLSLLLERYMGGGGKKEEEEEKRHVILGCPFANRGWTSGWTTTTTTTTTTTPIDGCLVNVLPVPLTFTPQKTIADVIRSADVSIRTVQSFERASFEGVLSDLGVSRRHDSTPLFGVVFAHHDAGGGMGLGGELGGGVEVEYVPWRSRSAKFEMTVTLFEREGKRGRGEGEEEGSCFLFEYRSDLFSKQYVESITDNFHHILRWISGCGGMGEGEGEGRDVEKVGWRDVEVLSERNLERLSKWSLPRFFFLFSFF